MRKRFGSSRIILLDEDVPSVARRGAFFVVLVMGLISPPLPVLAFPETTSGHVSESDAFPPTYLAEQQSTGNSSMWSSESIFFRPPHNDPAGTHGNLAPSFGGHPGAAQFEPLSTRQRIQDLGRLIFPDIESPLRDLQIIDITVYQAGPDQRARRRDTGAEPLLIDSGFGEFILDIVEPNLEAGGLFLSTIQELGRIPLMFLREVRTFVGGEPDRNDSSRRSTSRNLSSGPATSVQIRQVSRQNRGINSGQSLMQRLFDGAIAVITHPGFIAFAIILIGLLFLRKSRGQNG